MEINEIQNKIHKELTKQASSLSNFNTGSVLYTLTRAIAAGIYEMDYYYRNYQNNFNLLTAENTFLDNIAASFNLSRKPGILAKGNVLAFNLLNNTSIPVDTLLTDPISKNEYYTTSNASVSSLLETRISVEAASVGSSFNLPAGSSLISSDFPNTLFYVADYRSSSGLFCGGIFGGQDSEDDSSFRQRIVDSLYSPNFGTTKSISFLLDDNPLIDDYFFSVLFPNVVDVWLFTSSEMSESQITELANTLSYLAPLGISIKPFRAIPLPIDISLSTAQTLSPFIVSDIKLSLNNFLRSSLLNPPVSVNNIRNFLLSQYNISFDVSLDFQSLDSLGFYYKINNLNLSYPS